MYAYICIHIYDDKYAVLNKFVHSKQNRINARATLSSGTVVSYYILKQVLNWYPFQLFLSGTSSTRNSFINTIRMNKVAIM